MDAHIEYPEERDAAVPNSALARWEHATSIPILLLALLWIVITSLFILDGPDGIWRSRSALGLYGLWGVFVVDYAVRFVLAARKLTFLRESVFDFASVVIPLLRPFHLLTYLRSLPYFRRPTPAAFRVRTVVYGVSFAVIFVYTISLYVLEAERHAPGANILTLGDSLWWAATTLSTVGYGDMYPVTTVGRIFAVTLMAGGVVFVGVSSAVAIQVLNGRLQKLARAHHGDDATAHIEGHPLDPTAAKHPDRQ